MSWDNPALFALRCVHLDANCYCSHGPQSPYISAQERDCSLLQDAGFLYWSLTPILMSHGWLGRFNDCFEVLRKTSMFQPDDSSQGTLTGCGRPQVIGSEKSPHLLHTYVFLAVSNSTQFLHDHYIDQPAVALIQLAIISLIQFSLFEIITKF